MRISDWSSDVCSSDLLALFRQRVELHAVNVAQQALQPQLAVNAGTARHLQRLLRRGDHGLRGDGLARQHLARKRHRRREVEIVGEADHVGHRQLRSEEHTSELQSLMRISYAVFCLKKKNTTRKRTIHHTNRSYIKTHERKTHIVATNRSV